MAGKAPKEQRQTAREQARRLREQAREILDKARNTAQVTAFRREISQIEAKKKK
jgi:hypothetical protein